MAGKNRKELSPRQWWRRIIHSDKADNPVRAFVNDEKIDNIILPMSSNRNQREGLIINNLTPAQIVQMSESYNRGNTMFIGFGDLNRSVQPEVWGFNPGDHYEATVTEEDNSFDPPLLGGQKADKCQRCGRYVTPNKLRPRDRTVVNSNTGESYVKKELNCINPCVDENADDSEFGAFGAI